MDLRFFCIIFLWFIVPGLSDQDFFTVFRIGKFSSEVQTELHRMTNTIGLPLRTRNGFFIDSVEDMPSMKCSPAIEGCEWTKSSNWTFEPVDVLHDEQLSVDIDKCFNLHGLYETCDDYKGGCEFLCSRNTELLCTCPFEAKIQTEDMSCILDRKITSSGHYEDNDLSDKWYIIPPVKSSIEMNIYWNYGIYLYTSEVSRASQMTYSKTYGYDDKKQHIVIEEDTLLEMKFQSVYSSNYLGLRGDVDIKRNHLTLNGDQGTLTYKVNTQVESLCISVIYQLGSHNGTVNMQMSLLNGTNIPATKVQEQSRGNWTQKVFYASVGQPITPVRLSLEVSGEGTTIYSINGCSPYGIQDTTVTKVLSSLPAKVNSLRSTENKENSVCLNGGITINETEECICPAGFRGSRCQEGCGPNSYGNDCSATCSNYNWGCSRMIFCKPGLPCMCAPGYTGKNCDTECPIGSYGANCSQNCGKCKRMSCDIYTGICLSNCISGFYPPYCVTPYKYIETTPIVTHEDFDTVNICFNISSTKGEGEMKYYQIQHLDREATEKTWIETLSSEIKEQYRLGEELICGNITDLLPGHNYTARVVLIAKDGNSYQDELVPETNFTSMCSVPQSPDYGINHKMKDSGFTFRWHYETNRTECRITNFTLILRRKGQKIQTLTKEAELDFDFLIPNTEYELKIKANTEGGSAPFSPNYAVKTGIQAPQYVSQLEAQPNGKKKLIVSWIPPRGSETSLDKYIIEYKCVQCLACPKTAPPFFTGNEECYGSVEKEFTLVANKTSVSINDLLPHAAYMINVAGVSGNFTGPFRETRGLTDNAEPDVAPTMSGNPVVSSTNTSIIVQWGPSEKCDLFNGYFAGYRYELLAPNKTLLQEGYTRKTNATFRDLLPQATYEVNVFLLSSGGMNRGSKITFNVSTKATVPSEVQDLRAYKRGRRLIGLRWKEPQNLYGVISSFSVSHCQINGECVNEVSTRIHPAPCSAWPDYYCYTINNNLRPNKQYSITVKARNAVIEEDGNAATITASTSEGEPQTPLELRIINMTSQSATIQWKPPFSFNGILRSFLVNVEHMDSANSSNCCVYFPLHEIPVTEERKSYTHEVNGLSPASKYVIGISAKTLSIGSSSTLTVNTHPEVPELIPLEIIDDFLITIPTQNDIVGVTSTFLLVVIPENENVDSKIFDSDVKEKLDELITENYYVVGEYRNDELPVTVSLGTDVDSRNGTFAVLQNADIPENFRVGLAVILDYNGSKNVGFITTPTL